ncbi:hypothetical protein [Leptothermofonsia sp. ETS-13]|uniref:hypothetical protein n=1 Tax=Leptothermofonsia sp. ETS-13 TaxID=3035696 RepID=UPI003BA0BCE6
MTSSYTIGHRLSARRPARRVKRSQQNTSRFEANRWVLLMQAGWVAIGLIAVASFPDIKSLSANPFIPPQTALTYPLKATAIVADPALLFANGSESLIARTIGHAEGTRAPDGTRTPAYFGHTDSGNGVWNLGSFSFQHCRELRYRCSTPEQADAFQLQRLKTQADYLRQRSLTLNLKINLEEELNAIDLANQAPLAALGKPGYPDYLQQAKNRGKKGQDAILEARVWSFWNPETKRWDAPGLGNTEASIRHDQKRRMLAIARVLAIYQPQTIAQSAPQRHTNGLASNKQALENPYSFQTQQTQYLWWDAGYWDAKLGRGRQVPEGFEVTYDAGFRQAMMLQ